MRSDGVEQLARELPRALERGGGPAERLLLVSIGDAAATVAATRLPGRCAVLGRAPLFTAGGMADLLASFRATGLDAQGTVLNLPPQESGREIGRHIKPVRMGGGCLAEVVADALAGPEPA